MKVEIPDQGLLEIGFAYESTNFEVKRKVELPEEFARKIRAGMTNSVYLVSWMWKLKAQCVLKIGEQEFRTWVWDEIEAVDQKHFPGFDYITIRKRALAQALLKFYPSGESYAKSLENKNRRRLVWQTLLEEGKKKEGFKMIPKRR